MSAGVFEWEPKGENIKAVVYRGARCCWLVLSYFILGLFLGRLPYIHILYWYNGKAVGTYMQP